MTATCPLPLHGLPRWNPACHPKGRLTRAISKRTNHEAKCPPAAVCHPLPTRWLAKGSSRACTRPGPKPAAPPSRRPKTLCPLLGLPGATPRVLHGGPALSAAHQGPGGLTEPGPALGQGSAGSHLPRAGLRDSANVSWREDRQQPLPPGNLAGCGYTETLGVWVPVRGAITPPVHPEGLEPHPPSAECRVLS